MDEQPVPKVQIQETINNAPDQPIEKENNTARETVEVSLLDDPTMEIDWDLVPDPSITPKTSEKANPTEDRDEMNDDIFDDIDWGSITIQTTTNPPTEVQNVTPSKDEVVKGQNMTRNTASVQLSTIVIYPAKPIPQSENFRPASTVQEPQTYSPVRSFTERFQEFELPNVPILQVSPNIAHYARKVSKITTTQLSEMGKPDTKKTQEIQEVA